MKIDYAIVGAKESAGALAAKGPAISRAARDAAVRLTYELEAYVKGQKLSGQVLHVRTGNLRNSVNSQFREEGGQFVGTVGTAIAYAAIHEFGGTIQRHMQAGVARLRTNAKGELLRQGEGRLANLAVFAKASHKRVREVPYEARDYTIVMPMRSFLRSSLREQRDNIMAQLRLAARGAIK